MATQHVNAGILGVIPDTNSPSRHAHINASFRKFKVLIKDSFSYHFFFIFLIIFYLIILFFLEQFFTFNLTNVYEIKYKYNLGMIIFNAIEPYTTIFERSL